MSWKKPVFSFITCNRSWACSICHKYHVQLFQQRFHFIDINCTHWFVFVSFRFLFYNSSQDIQTVSAECVEWFITIEERVKNNSIKLHKYDTTQTMPQIKNCYVLMFSSKWWRDSDLKVEFVEILVKKIFELPNFSNKKLQVFMHFHLNCGTIKEKRLIFCSSQRFIQN